MKNDLVYVNFILYCKILPKFFLHVEISLFGVVIGTIHCYKKPNNILLVEYPVDNNAASFVK